MGGKKLPSVPLDIPETRGSWALFRRSIPPFLPSRIRLGLSGRPFAADAIASGRELLGEQPAGKPIESLYPFWSACRDVRAAKCERFPKLTPHSRHSKLRALIAIGTYV